MTPISDTLFMRAARGEQTPRPPVWFMRQAGRSDPAYRDLRADFNCPLEEAFRKPTLAAFITLLPMRLPVDAVIVFQDILTPLSGMGAPFVFRPGPTPTKPVRDIDDLESLHLFDMAKALPYMETLYRWVRFVLKKEPVPILGFAGAPFTLLAFLAENGSPPETLPRTRALMREAPERTRRVLDMLADMTSAYLRFQLSCGAHATQLFESAGHCLSPDEYKEWALPAQQRVFAGMRETDGPTILFARRNDTAIPVETLHAAGASVLSLPAAYSIAEARAALGESVPLQGNLDNRLLAEGEPDAIIEAARRCIEEGGCRGHIFNLSHGLLPHTPYEHVQMLVDFVRGYGQEQ